MLPLTEFLLNSSWGESFPGGAVRKNPPANVGDARDMGLIPGSGRSSGEENGNCSNILARKIPYTEEPDGLQSMGSQRIGHY